MKRIKRMPVFLTGGLVGLILLVAVPRKASEVHEVEPGPSLLRAGHGSSLQADHLDLQLAKQRERSKLLSWERDPFRPPLVPDALTPLIETRPSTAGPRLTGISYVGDKWMAIIGSEVVERGDFLVSGHEVLEITDATATLMLNREELTLSLGDKL